jgi:PIN domain nuclease of toxin-antitoxin system
MNLLLDTHVVLWAALEPERLRADCRAALEDRTNQVHVSAVSAWEMAIKQSLGKLELSLPAEQWLPKVLRKTGFDSLSVDVASALRVRSLPWHHRDPFDRLLVAQALQSGLTLATHDPYFAPYGVSILAA